MNCLRWDNSPLLLVFEHNVKSLSYSLSRDRLLFNQILFRQLCVNWFVGVLDLVERVDIVEDYKQLSYFGVLGKTCYLFQRSHEVCTECCHCCLRCKGQWSKAANIMWLYVYTKYILYGIHIIYITIYIDN